MELWPFLAAKAFRFEYGQREIIFYYDSSPSDEQSLGQPSSRHTFVLIHGLGDEADSWRYIIPLLNERGSRALAMDLPGFGRSVTRKKISVKNHAVAVTKLLEKALPGDEVFLVGSSLGALVAESVAFQRPDLVKGIILIDGGIPGGPSRSGFFALFRLLFSRKWYRDFRHDPEGAWASLYPYYADLDNMSTEDKVFLRQRVMERVNSSTQEDAFFATQRSIVWNYLTKASAYARKVGNYSGKILLIWGERDKIIPFSVAKAFKTLRSDISLEVIPGAGHLPQQEKPEETAQLMADFVNA